MCLAMEIEVPSAGDSNGRGLNDAAALGPRPSQLPRDFFVPLSQREKATRRPGGDEVAQPAAAMVENGTKRRRRQVKKYAVDDASLDKGKDGPGKLSGTPAKNLLASELTPGKGSPSGAGKKVTNRKRGRPRKIFPDDNDEIVVLSSPEKEQRSDVKESGEPPKACTEDQDEMDNGARLSTSLKNSVTSPERCHVDDHAGPVSVTEEDMKPDSLMNPHVREPSQRTVGRMKRLNEIFSSGQDDSRVSQSTPAQDFFMPASRRRRKGDSPGDKKSKQNEAGAVKRKSQANGQAAKNRLERAAGSTRLQSNVVKDKDENPASSSRLSKGAATVPSGNGVQYGEQPTLRQEAVLAAQEIARMNAGKATHPFFARKKASSLKSSVPWDETSAVPLEEVYPGAPIHVTQLPLAESVDLKWTGWTFGSALANKDSQAGLSGRFMKQLQFPSLAERQQSSWRLNPPTSTKVAENAAANIDRVPSGGVQSTAFSLGELQDFIQEMKVSRSGTEPFTDRGVSTPLSLESLKNRLSWYIGRHENQRSTDNANLLDREAAASTRNLLWTDLYQPKSATEVCGNVTSVELLSTWLNNWLQKINGHVTKVGEGTKKIEANGTVDYESDDGWFVDDADFNSDVEDDSGLHNTLLITGPEGCGKSAAIYACAGEQGFTVLEVNASDCRNGALIKHKFGEAMESHGLGKAALVNAESSMAATMKAPRLCNNGSPEPSKEKAAKTINAVGGKRKADKSPLKAGQLASGPNQEEFVVESHSRRNTVILFEDVDKHFEEDKGFLTALVQLSKATKRPIILTSNRAEPGLPPVLEKSKIQFGYPTPEELILHACLVCRAEDTLVTPWFVKHLIDTCQFDIRKIMMALQFWGQGKALSRQPSGIGKLPDGIFRSLSDVTHDRQQSYPSRDRLSLRCRRSSSLAGPSESLISNHEKDLSELWSTDARWLFELDVHHLILPKLISGTLECPLSLFIAERLSKAVNELDDHEAQVAASETEERSRMLQANFEAADRIRKEEKRLKNGRRRSSEWEPRIPTDWIVSSPNPDEDAKEERRSGTNWVFSPTSSLRKAKTMARSPLKSPALKSRRALLLSDSDDEQMQLAKHVEASRHSLSKSETTSSSTQMLMDQSQVSIAVSGHLEDLDVTHPVCRSSVTGRRKRLQKKSSNGLLPDNPIVEDSQCISFEADLPALEQQVAKCEPAAEILSSTYTVIVDTDQNDNLAVPSDPLKLCRVTPESKEDLAVVSDVEIGDQRIDSAVPDTDEYFVDKPANSISSVQLPGAEGASSALLPRLSYKEEIGVFGMVDQVDTGEARLAQSPASGIENSYVKLYSATCTDSAEQITATGDLVNLDSNVVIRGQQADSTERSPSEVYNPVTDTSCTDSAEQIVATGDLVNLDSNVAIRAQQTDPTERSPSDVYNPVKDTSCTDSAEQIAATGDLVNLDSTVVISAQQTDPTERSPSEVYNPVKDTWTTLRDSRQELKLMANQLHHAGDYSSQIFDLFDVISAADVISSVETEEYKAARVQFDGKMFEAFEGNIGHCHDWDGCREIASQLVRSGLRHSLVSLPSVSHVNQQIPLLASILEGAKDAAAVGKCMTRFPCLSRKVDGAIANNYSTVPSTRQTDRQNRLEEAFKIAVAPKVRVSRLVLVEYCAYLSLICQAEEARKTRGFTDEGRRPRRFEHCLTSKLKSFSEADMNQFRMVFNFGKP